jgi:serine phosphatase RsbU (regulator of sigma subunit)
MTEPSLTGTQTFAGRMMKSERWRLCLMALVLLFTLIIFLIRRHAGGVELQDNSIFIRILCILIWGLIYQAIVGFAIWREGLSGITIPFWQRWICVVMDLAVPGGILMMYQIHAPPGDYSGLSSPALLLIPIVILLSILRLQPWFTFWTGLGGAVVHWLLVIKTIQETDIDWNHLPVLISYGVLLFLTGVAASVVASMVRANVVEAVGEATAAQTALRTVALIEQDLHIARDIQMGLLPSEPPQLEGFDVTGMARPATEAGGDYYDWQPLADGRLVVAIADVTGHGIGPALVMAVCRAYARASAPVLGGPEALMQVLNGLIYEDVKGARFITMALAVVSKGGGLELVSAGHGPTLLYHAATHEVQWFGGDGLPLGVRPEETYGPTRKLQMDSGDVLLMITDGFFEHQSTAEKGLFGMERLINSLKRSARGSPEQIIEALDLDVKHFAQGKPQADDMTAVVIKKR